METNNKTIVRVDNFTRFCLGAITVLLCVLVVGLWGQSNLWPEKNVRAADTPFDGGAQRKAMVEAQDRTTDKVNELIQLLKDGKAKVQVVASDEEKDKPKK